MSDTIVALPYPNVADYTIWIRQIMGIGTDVLPDDALVIPFSLQMSLHWVSQDINTVDPFLFTVATYNLAGHFLVTYAPDIPPSTYFADLRSKLGMSSFVVGFANSASDEGTSGHLFIPDFFSTLTLADMALLQTPWGRRYMAIAQQIGSLWGLSG